MPITLLHYPVALGFSKLGKKMVLPGLIVGSFIPDIEVPFLIIFFHGVLPDHLILHSLIGAVTIGTILAVIVTRYFYPPLVSIIFRLNRNKLDSKCRLTSNLVLSCMLGNLFHILLDITMHPCNPVLWPWINPNDKKHLINSCRNC